jgi:metallophosphoesterase (TIGR03767 family)
VTSPPDLVTRTDLASAPAGAGSLVASLCQISDLHVLDGASPMRFEWIETQAHDPRWRPLLHMHRPQESLVPWAVQAHVDRIREHGACDLVISTGDNIDNAQRNELDVYLALLAGGSATLSPFGGPQDARADDLRPWPYWSPDPGVDDLWKAQGYPAVPDLLERASEPIESHGLQLPWTSMPGNHDLLCQGTAFVDDALTAAAVGGRKALFPPPGFAPDDALTLFVDDPAQFLGVGDRTIPADPSRRGIDLREWLDAHVTAGATGWSAEHVARGVADTTIELGEVTVVVLDTNHPAGDYQGSVGLAQLAWLDDQLTAIDAAGGLAVLASHHGSESLVNDRGHLPDRVLAAPMLDVVHRHPCVVAWLVGHRHIHRVVPRPGAAGGFWEITTASIIDWPSERRTIDVVRHADGAVELVCRVHAHRAPEHSLAWWHAALAQRFGGSQVRHAMAGTELDRDVRLFVRR